MYKLLIADDERTECDTLKKMLAPRFEQLVLLQCVYDGVSLVRRIEEEQPDIVIADINMPGMSGLDALEQIHERHQGMQIIINTAYRDFSFARRALRCGACDYALKPCNKEYIIQAVKKACSRLDELRGASPAQPAERETRPAQDGAVVNGQAAGLLQRLRMDTEAAERASKHIRRAMEFIRGHYTEDISLDDVAGACGISSFYMSRMFKQELGESFVTLLTNVRLEQAVRLLASGSYKNGEIARAVGYNSDKYFSKVFSRRTGMTLEDYRRALGLERGEEEQP